MIDTKTLENSVFVVTFLCQRLKMSDISLLTALFTASLEVSTFRYLAHIINNGTLGSLFRTELPPAGSCCRPHRPMLSSQDV